MQLFHICYSQHKDSLETIFAVLRYTYPQLHPSFRIVFSFSSSFSIYLLNLRKSKEMQLSNDIFSLRIDEKAFLPFKFNNIRIRKWNLNAKLNLRKLNPINNTWNWTNKQRKAANGNSSGCLSFVELSMLTCFCWGCNGIRNEWCVGWELLIF